MSVPSQVRKVHIRDISPAGFECLTAWTTCDACVALTKNQEGEGAMLRWSIPALGVAVLGWAVALAFQGRFAVAFGIGVFAACCFQIDRLRQRLDRRTPKTHCPVRCTLVALARTKTGVSSRSHCAAVVCYRLRHISFPEGSPHPQGSQRACFWRRWCWPRRRGPPARITPPAHRPAMSPDRTMTPSRPVKPTPRRHAAG